MKEEQFLALLLMKGDKGYEGAIDSIAPSGELCRLSVDLFKTGPLERREQRERRVVDRKTGRQSYRRCEMYNIES